MTTKRNKRAGTPPAASMSDKILERAPAWLAARPVRIRPLQRLEADLVALAQELAETAPAPEGRPADRALVLLQLALELTAGRQAAEQDLRALLAMWEPVSKAADQLADRALELSDPDELSDELAAEAAKLAGLVNQAAEHAHRLVGLNDQDTPPPPPAGKETRK